MALSKERVGEIALALLTVKLKEDGVKLSSSTMRELNAAAHKAGISKEEVKTFLEDLLPELIGNALGYQAVSLEMKEPRKTERSVL